MKKTFTSFYAKTLALSMFLCAPMMATAQVIFSQSFGPTTTAISTYHSLTPSTNQFDFIGTSGTSSIYIASSTDRIQLQRGGNPAALTRTTDLAVVSNVLKIKFKLNLAFSTVNAGNMASFTVGGGFAASATGEAATNQHSRITLAFPTASGTFQLRNTLPMTPVNSPEYTGQQEITWYINNSGAPINYVNPSGGSSPLADDFADVWVGTSLVLTNAAITPTQSAITDFKFLFNNGGGAVGIDDIEISTGSTVLPVSLTDFKANKAGATNQLAWTTESETNNKGYDVERQMANGTWETLGFVKGTGKAATYTFEDKAPLSISYYRLRQMDFDGKETLSKVVSVSQDSKGRLSIMPNPTSDKVTINLNQNDGLNSKATLTLFDITGRQVLTQTTTTEATQLDLSNLAKGMYMLTVQSNNAIYQEKIIRQ